MNIEQEIRKVIDDNVTWVENKEPDAVFKRFHVFETDKIVSALARHVEAEILRATIAEIKDLNMEFDKDDFYEGSVWHTIDQRIADLEKRLKELGGNDGD